MLEWIFLIIAFLSLFGIGVIIVRKFPQLANLDLDSLPQEKNSRKKKEILSRRLQEKRSHLSGIYRARLIPLVKIAKRLQLRFRIYVGQVGRLLRHEQSSATTQKTVPDLNRMEHLIQDGERCLSEKKYEQAEEKFIAAIKLDNRAATAYSGLADTYFAKGSLVEARETYLFVLQIEPENDRVLSRLADIAESQNNLEEAIKYYEQAIAINDTLTVRFARLGELLIKAGQPEVAKDAIEAAVEAEPQNPKYLDLLAETAILCQDKTLALKVYGDLCVVNPENKKLPDLKQRIDLM